VALGGDFVVVPLRVSVGSGSGEELVKGPSGRTRLRVPVVDIEVEVAHTQAARRRLAAHLPDQTRIFLEMDQSDL
jgi:hypothetical protein